MAAARGDDGAAQKAIVLIDPVTDWGQVVDAAVSSDHAVVAVQMPDVALPEKFSAFLPSAAALRAQGASHVLSMHHRDVFSIARQLQILQEENALQIEGVIPLSEVAVEVSDLVASCLGLPHNPLDALAARRDKGLMKHSVESAIGSAEDLRAAVAKLSLDYPIVIKTPSGFSTTDVYISYDEDKAIRAVECIVGSTGPDGRTVDRALLEEYLPGTEFAINLLAFEDGNHVLVTDVWRYTKNEKARYDSAEICSPADHSELVSYAVDVARAVGIRYGAAHVELKARQSEDGRYLEPALIEVGARLSGGRKSLMAQSACEGWDPFGSLIASHCGRPCPGVPRERKYLTPDRFVRHLFLPVGRGGRIKEIQLETKGLRTLHSSAMLVNIGDQVVETTDIVSCAAFVWLVGEKAKVDEDTDAVLSSFSLIME
ncbi:hypothetical protein ACHAXT_006536 [Thalassiosira profunda]